MEKVKVWISGHSLLAASAMGVFVSLLASSADGASLPTNVITSSGSVVALFCGALNWMFWGLIVMSIVMFLAGGYMYATSAGEAEKVGRASKTLMYAAIGVVVALIARGVPTLIESLLTKSTDSTSGACS